MDPLTTYQALPVGIVHSSIKRRADAPRSGALDGPVAQIQIHAPFLAALEGITVGQEIIVLTWLHEARRETLQVHRRSNPENPLSGVFATRSPDRPNPIGLHLVTVLTIEPSGLLTVQGLEAIDGTPVVDIKPARTRGGDA
jgi:tRNA-Thr(GGU) m(6)t(6)A37 methyltransferase TsaA